MCVHVEARGRHQVLCFQLMFWDRVSHLTRAWSCAQAEELGSPWVLPNSMPQDWSYTYMLPCLAFRWLLGIWTRILVLTYHFTHWAIFLESKQNILSPLLYHCVNLKVPTSPCFNISSPASSIILRDPETLNCSRSLKVDTGKSQMAPGSSTVSIVNVRRLYYTLHNKGLCVFLARVGWNQEPC